MQDTTACAVIASHWEKRSFGGEIMTAVQQSMFPAYLSRVTLALFQDSGWYKANLSKADVVKKGAL